LHINTENIYWLNLETKKESGQNRGFSNLIGVAERYLLVCLISEECKNLDQVYHSEQFRAQTIVKIYHAIELRC
jgi:hypothetical protein